MRRFLNIFIMTLIGLAATASYGLSEPFPASPPGSVFANEDILNVELDAPLKELFAKNDANSKDEKVFVQGHLSYFAQNQKVTLPVRVRVKGNSTVEFCPFKKMEIKFKSADTTATIFENMKSIDLNTHCAEVNELDVYEQHFNGSYFNHREVVVYKMAKVLSVPTFQVRALSIRYKNTGLKVDQTLRPYQAFFIEDTGDLLKRIQAREIKIENLPPGSKNDIRTLPQIAIDDLYRAILFNGLVRNSDWDFPRPQDGRQIFWNMKLIETAPGKWIPMVYDFNLAPVVTLDKSYPLDISSFLKADEEIQARVLATFQDKRAELYELLESLQHDKPAYEALKICLDGFFEKK
jgi:hypothetical protein